MAVTLDKDCAKRLVASARIAVPQALAIYPTDHEWKIDVPFSRLPFPVIVKPAWEGSSKGIREKCLVNSPEELPEVIEWLRGEQRQPVLVEEYIQGDEVTVGILGNENPDVLGIMRVSSVEPVDNFVYSLEVKRDFRKLVRYECPPPLPSAVVASVREADLTVFRILGCRDVARIDFRVKDGVPYFIEVNPLPGLNPQDSDLVIMANLVGWSHARLVETILQAGLDRDSQNSKTQEPNLKQFQKTKT